MSNFSAADHAHMARALRLAERGLFTTTPNPRVGCVLVRDGQVVGEGWHELAGHPHAEVHALRAAGERARGATAYVTLEPCSHHGRTPPCAHALIDAGVVRVVAAMRDPNPQVAGSGIGLLTLAGIQAEVGLLEAQAAELNIGFLARMTRGRPWLRLKTATSLDGKTALENGVSKWITGPAARSDVQFLRARACAILTGVGTVLADDPRMNVREFRSSRSPDCPRQNLAPTAGGAVHEPGAQLTTLRQPLKIIVDSHLRTPATAQILNGGALIVCAVADPQRCAVLQAAGAEVLVIPGPLGRVGLSALIGILGQRGLNEIHVEAGATLNGALLGAGLVDEWIAYLAPLVLGDAARGVFALPPLKEMADRKAFRLHDSRQVGDDLRLTLRPV